MSTPKLFSSKPNPAHKSMLPVPKSSQKPVTAPPATPSLSLPRAASASLIETRDRSRARHKPPVLSYNQLSQDNQRLRREMLYLRSALEKEGTERREEHEAMSSEVSHLTVRLTEANSAVSQLSAEASTHQEQSHKLLSLLEGRGVDPLSGDEVLTREQRLSTSRAAAERTRAITEFLNRQSARHTAIQTSLREKREAMLTLLSGDVIDTRFLATSPVPTGIRELLPHSCN